MRGQQLLDTAAQGCVSGASGLQISRALRNRQRQRTMEDGNFALGMVVHGSVFLRQLKELSDFSSSGAIRQQKGMTARKGLLVRNMGSKK
jgi:hypothetical protein